MNTAMGLAEQGGENGGLTKALIEQSAMKRAAEPHEIASAVTFLLSEAAAFVTGTDLLVDGGVVASLSPGIGR